jgi:hypothetical protein
MFFVVICAIVIMILALRAHLKSKSKKFIKKISQLSPYSSCSKNISANIDIQTDLEKSFNGEIISAA